MDEARARTGEAGVEVDLFALLAPCAWSPQCQKLRQVLDAAQDWHAHVVLIAQLARAPHELAHAQTLDLADAQRVTGLEQSPGRRRGRRLQAAMRRDDRGRAE